MAPVMENVRIFLQGLGKAGMFLWVEPFGHTGPSKPATVQRVWDAWFVERPTEAKVIEMLGCSSPPSQSL